MERAVIYFSLSSNTRKYAQQLAEKLGCDIFEIETVKPMPTTKGKAMMLGGMQASFGVCPKIKELSVDFSKYDEIIIGTPVWAGKPAPALNTFFKSFRFADRIRHVFTLSGGGDNISCIETLKKTNRNIENSVSLFDAYNEKSSENEVKFNEFVERIINA